MVTSVKPSGNVDPEVAEGITLNPGKVGVVHEAIPPFGAMMSSGQTNAGEVVTTRENGKKAVFSVQIDSS